MYSDKENIKQNYKFKGNFVRRKTKQVIKYINNLRKRRYNKKENLSRISTPDLIKVPNNIRQSTPNLIELSKVVPQPTPASGHIPGNITQPNPAQVLKTLPQLTCSLVQLPAGLSQSTSSLVQIRGDVTQPQEVCRKELTPDLVQPRSVTPPLPDLVKGLTTLHQPTVSLVQLPPGLSLPTSSLAQITSVLKPQEECIKKAVPQPMPALVQVPRSAPQPQKVCFKKNLLGINQIYQMQSVENVVKYERLLRHTQEFRNIVKLFPEIMFVKRIEKIQAPFLKRSFDLRREFHYNNIEPKVLFHGTKYDYLDEISTYNFNWRYSGLERGHRYGKGVNFTLDPEFAAHFCDTYSLRKIIIVADVLVIKDRTGREDMNVPPEGYDTATRENKRTFVKFDDSDFLPKYVVTFDWNRYQHQNRLRDLLWNIFF